MSPLRGMLLLLAMLPVALPLAACGHKSNLKTPTQMEMEEAKKVRRSDKEARKAAEAEAKRRDAEQQQQEPKPGEKDESGHDKSLLY